MTLVNRHTIVGGVRLAYRYTPGHHGDPLVFLHGTPSHSFLWRNVIPAFEAQGHRVLTFDLLGFGASERPRGRDTSVTSQVDLLGLLLDQLDIGSCTLVAHDIGGAIAQIFAARHQNRVRRMMLLDSVSYDSWPSPTWRLIRDHLDDHSHGSQAEFDAMLTRQLLTAVADPSRMTGAVLDEYLAPHRSALGRMSFFEHQVRHYDAQPTRDIAPALKTLSMPVRVVWGELDRWQPLDYGERLARDIPNAELITIADAGHFLMEDQPHRVVEEIHHLIATPT